MANLAWTYKDLEQGTAAKLQMQQLVEASRKILGEDHFDTITRQRWLDHMRLDHTNTEDSA
jgi:hypothetical protein